ncbi:DNA polymerase alpha subunit B [Copidosoma floridanum]|uniref:DNA polymerase alpha subunit B n=1 Tax=Copidosoma floridanum TaxID=29053 RepID=UPI0006C96131|nr:DNA polymerase alpha subunit B [Copidosoma floridanum]
MFELLKTTSEVRTRVCRSIGIRINNLWAAQSSDDVMITWNVRTRHQQKYRTWGRVCFDSETKQSNPTVLLEGCRQPPRTYTADTKNWPQVELDVSELRECCLFPGQIVAVEGLNLTENLLKVSDMFRGSYVPVAAPPKLTDKLNLVVAAGPFTRSNDLNYQPLWELMDCVAEEEPHVLVLIGPFIDYNHPDVQNNAFTCTYQDFFNKLILRIKGYLEGKCTQVVLVASNRDVHHYAVYPTPEYFIPKSVQSPEVHVLPDPCTLDIDGLRLGITSTDCLMHLGRQEVTLKSSGMDKLSRLGNHILNQACFYPLYPPAKEVNVDSELWEKYAFLREKPHMLFLPSDMRYFCKAINDSVILNPERLSKRTFAKVNFKPGTDGWTQDNISCEIIKM